MQQEASRKLGFPIKKTMSVAQGLFEGIKVLDRGTVGLITYMRTDSTRVSEEAQNMVTISMKTDIIKNQVEHKMLMRQ